MGNRNTATAVTCQMGTAETPKLIRKTKISAEKWVANRSSMEPNCAISLHHGELSNTTAQGVRCPNTVDDRRIDLGWECSDFGSIS